MAHINAVFVFHPLGMCPGCRQHGIGTGMQFILLPEEIFLCQKCATKYAIEEMDKKERVH